MEERNEARVRKLNFALLRAKDVRKRSVVEITTDDLYSYANVPHPNGPLDLRMGTVDRRIRCATCGHGLILCNGHEGHIELGWPVYHYGLLPYTLRLLRACCFFCSHLAIPSDSEDSRLKRFMKLPMGKARFCAITTLARNGKACPHCNEPRPKYSMCKKLLTITVTWPVKATYVGHDSEALTAEPFTAREARDILAGISNESCRVLGINDKLVHPKHYIMEVFSVSPPITRPTIMVSGGSVTRSHDDLTKKISAIVNRSNIVRNSFVRDCQVARLEDPRVIAAEVSPSVSTLDQISKLQYHTATFMNNDISGVKQDVQRSGVPIKGIAERCKTKHGHIRGRMVGKREDESARTVIIGDPSLDVDQVGVPHQILDVLTFEEKVSMLNWHTLQEACNAGRVPIVFTDKGEKISVKVRKEPITLKLGWTVKRNLRKDDHILLNRQPTLHKKSLMAFRIQPVTSRAIRLNFAVTGPYNADMDGDEMNLFGLLNHADRAEAIELMAVDKQILNAANNKPCIGLVQDALSGGYRLTCADTFLRKDQMMGLRMHITASEYLRDEDHSGFSIPPPTILKPKELWTGKQAFSMLLPAFLTLSRHVRGLVRDKAVGESSIIMDNEERCVNITNGELISGRLCKQVLGAASGGIVHALCKIPRELGDGCRFAVQFMSDAQRVINEYLLIAGFSVGYEDCLVPAKTGEVIRKRIADARTQACQLQQLQSAAGLSQRDLERKTSSLLCNLTSVAGNIGKTALPPDNPFLTMAQSGAKGNVINIAQITACVGQQSIEGQRIGVMHPNRQTLPSYAAGDNSIEKHGFIQHSYTKGLTPQEFFYHTMAGREGLSDTAVKTATTGYIQRRMIKAMEDLQVFHDGSVRNAEGYLVWEQYGGDGFDPALLEKWPGGSVLKRSLIQIVRDKALEKREYTPLARLLYYTRSRHLKCYNRTVVGSLRVPYNPERLLLQATNLFRAKAVQAVVPADQVFKDVQMLCRMYRQMFGSSGTLSMRLAIRSTCTIHRVTSVSRLTERGWEFVVNTLVKAGVAARVQAGEMVGLLAAESIGSLVTQLTLNTFHYAGVAEHNTTLGVPRLMQLIDCSGKSKYAEMTVALKKAVAFDRASAQAVADKLARLQLKQVLCAHAVWQAEEFNAIMDEDERWLVEQEVLLRVMPPLVKAKYRDDAMNVHVARFELDMFEMRTHGLKPVDVARAIEAYSPNAHVLPTPTPMKVWFVRVRIPLPTVTETADVPEVTEAKQLVLMQAHVSDLLMNVQLRGIAAVEFTTLGERSCYTLNTNPVCGRQLTERTEYVVHTVGTCLRHIWSCDNVDWKRTTSNDVHETIALLGLEAGLSVLFHELKRVLSFDGTHIDDRHIALLINLMSFRGEIMPLTRHGINKVDVSVMCKVSFEECMDVMFEAAAFGHTDEVKGVTVNLMLGRKPFGGTNFSSVFPAPSMKPKSRWLSARENPAADLALTHTSITNLPFLLEIIRKDKRKFMSHVVFSGAVARLKPIGADNPAPASTLPTVGGEHLSAENLDSVVQRICDRSTQSYGRPANIEADKSWEQAASSIMRSHKQQKVNDSDTYYFTRPESPQEHARLRAETARNAAMQHENSQGSDEHVYYSTVLNSPTYIAPTSPSADPSGRQACPASPLYSPCYGETWVPPLGGVPTSPSYPTLPYSPTVRQPARDQERDEIPLTIPMHSELAEFLQPQTMNQLPRGAESAFGDARMPIATLTAGPPLSTWCPSSPSLSPVHPPAVTQRSTQRSAPPPPAMSPAATASVDEVEDLGEGIDLSDLTETRLQSLLDSIL